MGLIVFCMDANNVQILKQPVLLVEEARVPGENHWSVASQIQTLSHNVVSSTPRHEQVWIHNFSGYRQGLHR
jgi:hypothetical protein